MKTELPKEDLNLIAQIDARLKHYNLIAPIEQVEKPKSIVKEEVKERFEVEVIERYFATGEHVIVIYTNNEKLGIEAAQLLADKTKALLATI